MPRTNVRVGIPVHVLYKIMCLARRPHADRRCKRDAALLITAVIFGLRPSGAEGIRTEHILELSELRGSSSARCEVLVLFLKGETVAQAERRGGRTIFAPAPVPGKPVTVLSVLAAWRDARDSAAAPWFDCPDLPGASLYDAVTSLTSAVGYAPPARCESGGHWEWHSARITAFSQAVPLGWSPLRLQIRFDWRSVEDMAGASFDHRVWTSAASLLFFDPALPEPECGSPAAESTTPSGSRLFECGSRHRCDGGVRKPPRGWRTGRAVCPHRARGPRGLGRGRPRPRRSRTRDRR